MWSIVMPKMKTNRGAAKRFKLTANGGAKHRRALRSHILTKKSSKLKQHRRSNVLVGKSDIKSVHRLLKLA